MTLNELYVTYYSIKKEHKDYRLGQHFVNEIGIHNPILFYEPCDQLASLMFDQLVTVYQWDINNIPQWK